MFGFVLYLPSLGGQRKLVFLLWEKKGGSWRERGREFCGMRTKMKMRSREVDCARKKYWERA